jgi:hypothetical protein
VQKEELLYLIGWDFAVAVLAIGRAWPYFADHNLPADPSPSLECSGIEPL